MYPTLFLLSRQQFSAVTHMKTPLETENQLLPTTAPTLELNVYEKGVVGHSPRYSRAENLPEVEMELKFPVLK